ncbi:MAG TPA: hypothetical protein VLG74_04175 [Blastocatellia bacterium]|nr:hypothetical protein [Blastocatellia bacterium]
MDTSTTETKSTRRLESARARDKGPLRTLTGWLREFFVTRISNSAVLFGVIPVGTGFGHWISKIITGH